MSRTALSSTARTACLDQVMRALQRSSLLGIPASALLALIFGSSVPLSRRLAFVAFVSIADVVTLLVATHYLRRRRRGETMARSASGLICTLLTAAAWGSPALFALPGAGNVELRAVYLLFVCGTSATYVVGTAARRLYFYASQLPMLVPVAIVFTTSSDHVTRLLGLAVPIYFVVMASLHHDVHSVVVSELQLREHNDETNARLVDANAQLVQRALRDELTGLSNRAAFIDALQVAVSDARERGAIVGVLYFDVDRLKVVNDSLGHATGDMLLVEIARRVHAMLRSTDLLARLGGDEFTMLLDQLHSHAEAMVIAERVAQSFVEPFKVGGRSIVVSASIGVATNVDPNDVAEALLSFADAAQYRAKQTGRNRIDVFDIRLRTAMENRLDDENALRDAMAQGSIVAWYQPEVDLRTGLYVGAEALARWNHPERGVLDAWKFVPLAEETGLVFALDDAIVANAVTTRAALAATGLRDDFRIWCNVSATHLTRGMPARQLADLLRTHGMRPEPDRPRDHRDRGASRRGRRGTRDRGGPGARGQGRARRLRDRALVAHTAALVDDRPGEDRPHVHQGLHERAPRRRDRPSGHRARARPRSRRRRRRGRDPGAGAPPRRARMPARAGVAVGEGVADRRAAAQLESSTSTPVA